MDEVTTFLYRYVINNNPHINEEDIESFKALNKHDLLIEFKSGIKEVYDTFANTSRRLQNNCNNKKTDKQLRSDFKRRLQILMNRKWVTQDELAKRIDTSQQMISRYLVGDSIPNMLTLKRIADALDCDVNDFYEEEY